MPERDLGRPLQEAQFENVFVRELRPLIPPAALKGAYPATEQSLLTVDASRKIVYEAITNPGPGNKLIGIFGPCSAHDFNEALEYARKVLVWRQKYGDRMEILMRLFFEKSRTNLGWPGLIIDPHLNGTNDMNYGVELARKLILEITAMGVPVATEVLDTITPNYYMGLVTWGALGARSAENPLQRKLASSLSCSIGAKNGTEGNFNIAIDALTTIKHPHIFPGTTSHGQTAAVISKGKPDCHIVLRGGKNGPNYDEESIAEVVAELEKAGHPAVVGIDFSHGNSDKDYKKQIIVATSTADQIEHGNTSIILISGESNLEEGKQELVVGKPLKRGLSITDGCAGLEETEEWIERSHRAMGRRAA